MAVLTKPKTAHTFTFAPPKAAVKPQLASKMTQPYLVADAWRRRFAQAFAQAVHDALVPDPDALTRALASGVPATADGLLDPHSFRQRLAQNLLQPVQRLLAARGQETLRTLRVPIAKAEGDGQDVATIDLSFALDNPYAIAAAQTIVGDLVSSVDEDTIDALRQAVANMIQQGVPPRQAANFIGAIAGLRPDQAAAVNRLRQSLLDGGLPSVAVDQKVAAYGQRLLRERGELIARTETIRASVAGTQAAWDQAVKAGMLDATQYGQQWLATDDDRTCPQCADADGSITPLGQPFDNGALGPPLHPNCRCDVGIAQLSPDTVAQTGTREQPIAEAGDEEELPPS